MTEGPSNSIITYTEISGTVSYVYCNLLLTEYKEDPRPSLINTPNCLRKSNVSSVSSLT